MVDFGRTFIGSSWLYAQEEYYYSDSFPRGKSYAKSNKVSSLEFSKNRVSAKVKGSYNNYYDVHMDFDHFNESDKEIILNTIRENPLYLSAIANNSFPKDLFDELGDKNVDLINIITIVDCNCPDFLSLPCKHIAAVIYSLSVVFDKNPLKLFELQGLNLKKELNIASGEITKVSDFFKKDEMEYGVMDFQALDLSGIPKLGDETFSFLNDNPMFYEKDFKKILNNFYRSFKRYAGKFLKVENSRYMDFIILNEEYVKSGDVKENFQSKWSNPDNWGKININLNDKFLIKSFSIDGRTEYNPSNEKFLVSILAESYIYSNIDDYNDNLKFLVQLFEFAMELIKKEAFVPLLLKLNTHYIIRFMPPLYNFRINKIVESLTRMAPEGMVTYNGQELSKKQEVLSLTSMLIHGILVFYKESGITQALSKNMGNPAFDIFLGLNKGFEGEYSGDEFLIKQWISKISFKYEVHNIYLEFKEKEDYITLDLRVGNKRVYDILLKGGEELDDVFRDISLIKKNLPEINELLTTGNLLNFDFHDFVDFLEKSAPLFEINGIKVVLPKSVQKCVKFNLALSSSSPDITKSYINQNGISKFNWEVAIGENRISVEEFEKLVKNSENIVKLANNYIILDRDEMLKFVKKLGKIQNLNEFELMEVLLSEKLEDIDVNIDNHLKNIFNNMVHFDEIPVPDNIRVELRDYQKSGFSWLVQNINNGFGSILADDMGLGKTVQSLAAIQHFKQEGMIANKKVLIVMPNGLLLNWFREIEKFTPDLKAVIYHGADRELPKDDYDILLTSYGILRSDKDIINELDWFLMIIDEAQNIKNPRTKQTRAVKDIDADNRIALSGTPVENRLSEYWSIFDFTNPHYLPSFKKFTNDYIKPIELSKDLDVLNRFKTLTEPFILRRLKTDKDIIKDLPDKFVNDVYCNLTVKQAAIYQETLDSLMEVIHDEEDVNRRGAILKLITSLKQICNHPAQFLKSEKFNVGQSGKMEVLIDILDNILANDEKVIIFTQYVQMGEIIKKLVEKKFKTSVGFLHGGLDRENKDMVIQDFQNNDKNKILLASLKTGGTGLNLTAAQNVIHYDLWWNPAVENQATDRAYRIGQKNNVMVYRLITSGTFEEEIDSMIKEKEELADLTVSTNQIFITEMDDKQLNNLLKLRN